METSFKDRVIKKNLKKMFRLPLYRFFAIVLGFPIMAFAYLKYLGQKSRGDYSAIRKQTIQRLMENGDYDKLCAEVTDQLKRKNSFLKKHSSSEKQAAELTKLTEARFDELIQNELDKSSDPSAKTSNFIGFFTNSLDNSAFFGFSVVFGFLMYLLVLIFSFPYVKYIFERLVMMVFVIFGVTFLVFTILYLSPMDPAKNVHGMYATPETIAEFNRVYGLDKSYLEQLFKAFKSIMTFDLGKSFVGNEDVLSSILRRFPVTLVVTFWSLAIAILIAIPAGIFSSIKQYSIFDYIFMLIALLGLSIPNFWLGYMLILNFSINSKLIPTFLYDANNWKTLIMPCIVLGTGLSASIARMARSSMLEVVKQDYIVTAKAKGLSRGKVIMKHVLGNALIPIVTVIGLQFGGMLGGSAVTEKVFNISGIGLYIVDKQFIPDIPIVLAGTVYVAIIVSIANLAVDILYAFLDPRIKSRMKSY